MAFDASALDDTVASLAGRLLDHRAADDHWDGHLASSALSTATATLALHLVHRHRHPPGEELDRSVRAGARWLIDRQNADGGWGDTIRSRSNISTTTIAWASLSMVASRDASSLRAVDRSASWLRSAVGDLSPDSLCSAILRRYGKDRTFSVPILMVLALTGKLGPASAGWKSVPQLPFELAVLPHGWFQHLRLPVVSYALPALIAIGQVRHRWAPTANPLARVLRHASRRRTHRVLRQIQPSSGGYLEATPLTSFVVMSLAGAGQADSPVVDAGVRFLLESMRHDGSWPIDTNLSTWVTTLAIGALASAGTLPSPGRAAMRRWLLGQQSMREHPFTHAAPGGWAWTPLSGGVPDADDTSGALVALRHLGEPDADSIGAASAGVRWLLGVQNRDGGIPTFCRGWGALPFDRSTPEITAHALRAWSAWSGSLEPPLQHALERATQRAVAFLVTTQRSDGSWIPLWFGNEQAADEENPVYGTARVLQGLDAPLVRHHPHAAVCRRRAVAWLLDGQNNDGGWGGDRGVPSSVEETALVLSAMAPSWNGEGEPLRAAVAKGTRWLTDTLARSEPMAAPIGLYFARLWYYEELYPIVFALEGLASVRTARCPA